ncbi:hypothetical protein F2P81_017427 [Scophthalmus maximus]|uniref:Uncharacterized protein n=1 Tax=Scophthalmus maximus TaxID=52904 RepID=A0A6A4S669_SCOMX|nr:hypothetical protein F2P81_017427 [Scophthalmus maximus]
MMKVKETRLALYGYKFAANQFVRKNCRASSGVKVNQKKKQQQFQNPTVLPSDVVRWELELVGVRGPWRGPWSLDLHGGQVILCVQRPGTTTERPPVSSHPSER